MTLRQFVFPTVGDMLRRLAYRYGGTVDPILNDPEKKRKLLNDIHRELYYDLRALASSALPWMLPANVPFYIYVKIHAPQDPYINVWFSTIFGLNIVLAGAAFYLDRVLERIFIRATVVYSGTILFFAIYGAALVYYFQLLPINAIIVVTLTAGGIMAITATVTAPVRYLFPLVVSVCILPVAIYFTAGQGNITLSNQGYMLFLYYGALLAFNHSDHLRRRYDVIARLMGHHTKERLAIAHKNIEAAGREIEERFLNVRKIKEKQAGDYYLTALLLEPLGGAMTSGQGIELHSLIRQNKRFYFRRKRRELGGAINISDRISVNQATYTVAVCAHCQSTGMPGAGGAIVFATSMRAILARTTRLTQQVGPSQQVGPLAWLRSAAQEINAVFRQFQGSMFAAYTLVLINEQDFSLYIVNAGYPHPVLMTPAPQPGAEPLAVEMLDRLDPLPAAGLGALPADFGIQQEKLTPNQILLLTPGLNPTGNTPDPRAAFELGPLVGRAGLPVPKIYRAMLKTARPNGDFTMLLIHRLPFEQSPK